MCDLLSKCATSIVGVMLLVVVVGMLDLPHNPAQPVLQIVQDVVNGWLGK